jgi:mRNA interferase RelE/StbE
MIKILIERKAEKSIKKLPKRIAGKVIEKIQELKSEPRPLGSRKIVGSEGDYRIRIGDYRVVYELDEENEQLIIMAVGHRRDVYKKK